MSRKYLQNIIISDLHIPYQDKPVVEAALDFIKDEQPDIVTINGDLMEMYDVSSFQRWIRVPSLQDEIEETKEFLARLRRKAPAAKIKYTGANHEYRLQSYIDKNAPRLNDLKATKLDELLELKKLKIEWIYNNRIEAHYKWGALLIGHWFLSRKRPGQAAYELALKFGTSVVQGHTHKQGMSIIRQRERHMGAYEPGCLCTLSPDWEDSPNWTQGFAVAFRLKGGNRFSVNLVTIVDNKFLYGDEEWIVQR